VSEDQDIRVNRNTLKMELRSEVKGCASPNPPPLSSRPHHRTFIQGGRTLNHALLRCLILLMTVSLGISQGSTYGDNGLLHIESSFADQKPFQHIAVDKNTGLVYAAGANTLYQLDSNLKIQKRVATGPVNSSLRCEASGCRQPDASKMALTDNINKILLIDQSHARLIVCGSARQGSCETRDLYNIEAKTRSVEKPIAANRAVHSTVAFIAPGPPNFPASNVLYIGVSFANNSVHRHAVPSVASRSLDDERFLDISVIEPMSRTAMSVNTLLRTTYPIEYVYGFASGTFSYFITVQKANLDNDAPYISKVIRVCQDDSTYESYTEIPIECHDSTGSIHNIAKAAYLGKASDELSSELRVRVNDDVLFVVFTHRDAERHPQEVLCAYSVKEIQAKFTHNIQECFNGNGHRGLDFISPSHPCIKVSLPHLDENFCGININTPLGGQHPVTATALISYVDPVTAVVTTTVGSSTVVYLGTDSGHLKRVLLKPMGKAVEEEEIALSLAEIYDKRSVLRHGMVFDEDEEHLYVLTRAKISMVKVLDCSVFTSCSDCASERRLRCGWCSREAKCTSHEDCLSTTDPTAWRTGTAQSCLPVLQVMPDMVQHREVRTLDLLLDGELPESGTGLECDFRIKAGLACSNCPSGVSSFQDFTTPAYRTAKGFNCQTGPGTDVLADTPYTAAVVVREAGGKDLASGSVTFFSCHKYRSCTECVSSAFPCDWCVDGHRCTHDSAEECRNDILVNGVARKGPSIRSGPSFCPRILPVGPQLEHVASGESRALKLKVDNIAQFITQTRFVCQFNIEGRVSSVNAQLLGDMIYCDKMKMEFTYTSPHPTMEVYFNVIWGGSKPLDNPQRMRVMLYQCQRLATSCADCFDLPEMYQCGWCLASGYCEANVPSVRGSCHAVEWLQDSAQCPGEDVPAITAAPPLVTSSQPSSRRSTTTSLPSETAVTAQQSVTAQVKKLRKDVRRLRRDLAGLGRAVGELGEQVRGLWRVVRA